MDTRITRVLAPNPGPMTGPGTNTYVIENGGKALVLDPGPIIPIHNAAIEHALGDAMPIGVAVTHTHPDHAPAANPLGALWSVPVLGFAPGPEFVPTETISDGETINIGATSLIAVHTPGHTADHCCFLLGDILFSGDHIMGGSTVVIEDAGAYMRSLKRLRTLGPATVQPGHGELIEDGVAIIDSYIAHRRKREQQIIEALTAGAQAISDVVDVVYAGIDPVLIPAATRQVEIQLIKLIADGRVASSPFGYTVRLVR